MNRSTLLIIVLIVTIIALAAPVAAETTIEWWQFWTDPSIKPTVNRIVAEFEKANPDIKVKVSDLTWANGHEKIVMALASDRGPDILELGSDWIAQFADAGHLADITEQTATDQDKYQGWGMAIYRERIYARPWILGTRVLFYNRALLRQAEYADNFIPISWSNLKEAAIKIDHLGKNTHGWGSNTAEKHRLYKKFLPFFWSNGARLYTPDGKYCILSSQKGIDALKFYKLLHDSCGYVANQRGIEDAFLEGKIGFIISGDWLLKRIELEKRTIDFGTTLIPGPKFTGRSFLGGEFLAVNAASDHKQAAMRFIQFVTSPENQVSFCKANRSANPSSVVAQNDPYFKSNINLQTFIKQIYSGVHPPVDPYWVNAEAAIEDAVEDALFGSGMIAEPLHKARKKIDRSKRK